MAGPTGRTTITNVPRPGRRFRQPPAPIRSSVPPCSGQSRPSPAGGREDAASLDRPCARRLCDLAVGTEECSRRGSNQRMDPTEQENDFNKDRKSLLCPDASPYSASFLTAVHMRRTSIARPPALTLSVVSVASPSRIRSASVSAVIPLASKSASVRPCGASTRIPSGPRQGGVFEASRPSRAHSFRHRNHALPLVTPDAVAAWGAWCLWGL